MLSLDIFASVYSTHTHPSSPIITVILNNTSPQHHSAHSSHHHPYLFYAAIRVHPAHAAAKVMLALKVGGEQSVKVSRIDISMRVTSLQCLHIRVVDLQKHAKHRYRTRAIFRWCHTLSSDSVVIVLPTVPQTGKKTRDKKRKMSWDLLKCVQHPCQVCLTS